MSQPWHQAVPKVELHLHLEGAIPLPAMWELIGKYGGDESVPDMPALAQRFAYRDFPHFIDTWIWKNGFLRELDDFALIAEHCARALVTDSVLYAEMFYSPSPFVARGLPVDRVTEAVRRGLDRVPEIRVQLICDLVRNFGPDAEAATVEEVVQLTDLGVVGIGIGGLEQGFPPEPFAPLYERARHAGLRTNAHAGENAGPQSIWGALKTLRAERIGHGTRAVEDEALLNYLAEHQVPLEVCPTSNVCTGVVADLASHPARVFLERGIPISLNSDDPAMFGTTLANEYGIAEDKLGFDRQTLCQITTQAVAAAWLPEPDRRDLMRRMRADPTWAEPR